MSDALPLPSRPNIDYYRSLAKDLARAAGDDQVDVWATRWLRSLKQLQPHAFLTAQGAGGGAGVEVISRQWRKHHPPGAQETPSLAQAQFFLAREHGFASWAVFAKHVEALAAAQSPQARFEAAADAIVMGDEAALRELLRLEPSLVQARSSREHRSTLLHYVSANGVEDYRQKTPANIVDIARALLAAGSDVNAESDAYGGHSTTLMLVATSGHPERAGVQHALLKLLLDHEAIIDLPDSPNTVTACLHNGRAQAGEFLAARGARLDIEGAAGTGRVDLVRELLRSASRAESHLAAALCWACHFGHLAVVELLLREGVAADAPVAATGDTPLHHAAYGAHAEIVRLLLSRGACVIAVESRFGGTPLDWALHGWQHREPSATSERYYEVVTLLAQAGAAVEDAAAEIVDARMQAALRGV